jgi:hypothetical protein
MVTINGKQYRVLAKYSAIKMFCDRKGIDFFEFPELLAKYNFGEDFKPTTEFLDDMSLMMLCFLQRGAEAAGEICDLTVNDMVDWLLEGNLAQAYDLIIQSQGQSKNVEATGKEQS